MAPVGYKDEGIAISNFILGDTADFTLDVYHAGALDFLSIKQGVSLLSDDS